MNIVVLGAGLMGKEVVRDVVQSDIVEHVYLADLNIEQAELFTEQLGSSKLSCVRVDATNENQLREVMAKGTVVVNALFYTFNERVAKVAIELGIHAVDLGGHIGGATAEVLAMNKQAQQRGVTIIPDLGVAPGMINILTGYGASKLDQVRAIHLYVGGVPVEPEPPLNYNIVFSLEGVFDHYTDASYVIRNGQRIKLPSLSEVESITFDRYGEMEAFHTSGGTSTLIDTFSNVDTLEYKTVRYPGHAEKFQLLVDLGLLDRHSAVTIGGQKLFVRDVMREQLTPQLLLKDKSDAVLVKVLVSGYRNESALTYEYNMITEKDTTINETAMARATANTVSIVAQMIGGGTIAKRGVWPPEQIVPGAFYIEEMAKRDVHIIETEKTMEHFS